MVSAALEVENMTVPRDLIERARGRDRAMPCLHRLVKDVLGGALVGHVSRNSTAVEARKRPAPKPTARRKPKRRRGRPRKGEEVVRGQEDPGCLERQSSGMSLDEMLDDLAKGALP